MSLSNLFFNLFEDRKIDSNEGYSKIKYELGYDDIQKLTLLNPPYSEKLSVLVDYLRSTYWDSTPQADRSKKLVFPRKCIDLVMCECLEPPRLNMSTSSLKLYFQYGCLDSIKEYVLLVQETPSLRDGSCLRIRDCFPIGLLQIGLAVAMVYNHTNIIEWVASLKYPELPAEGTIDSALAYGAMDSLEWSRYYYNMYIPTTKGMNNAAAKGNLDAMIWVLNNISRYILPNASGIKMAKENGYTHVVKWFEARPKYIGS
ncbi:MAG: hypothetical protein JKX76_01800 [Colwellia sp.]|nr:hypothetical protein [Colwellia sp.]